jgi:vacuolar-type H+-ATPase subunit E/Vma4
MSPAESQAQNDVAALERAILQEAQKEARQILADAQIKADGIRRQAEEAAKVEGEAILQQAQQEAETLLRQTVAKAQLEAQMLKLKRREQILEHTFAGARQRLTSVTTWPDYDQIVQHLIREAAQRPGSDAEFLIQVDAQTQQVLTEALLADLEKELEVHLRTPVYHILMGETP